MIRPEAAALLARWREALAGASGLAAGAYLLLAATGLPWLFGLALAGLGLVLLLSGLRRGRLRGAVPGPGVVEVVEGRIGYMGPLDGGAVALDALEEVLFLRDPSGEGHWRLAPRDDRPVTIPEGAVGADALLDALAPLPGFDGGAMVRARASRAPRTIVWRRSPPRALPKG